MPLGHYAHPRYHMSPLAKIALVKEEGRTGLCAHPLKFRRMWTDQGTRGKIPAAFWRPIPPPRYRCLGDLVTIDYSPPPARAVVCLHWSVVRKSVPGERVWWDIGSEAFDDVSLWGIRTAAGCAAVNTFLVLETYMKPSRTDGSFFCLPNEAFTDEGVSPVKVPFYGH